MKQVYVAERLQPPLSPQLWIDAYSTLSRRARNPAYWREVLQNGQWAVVGLYSVEAYFIFKVRARTKLKSFSIFVSLTIFFRSVKSWDEGVCLDTS